MYLFISTTDLSINLGTLLTKHRFDFSLPKPNWLGAAVFIPVGTVRYIAPLVRRHQFDEHVQQVLPSDVHTSWTRLSAWETCPCALKHTSFLLRASHYTHISKDCRPESDKNNDSSALLPLLFILVTPYQQHDASSSILPVSPLLPPLHILNDGWHFPLTALSATSSHLQTY